MRVFIQIKPERHRVIEKPRLGPAQVVRLADRAHGAAQLQVLACAGEIRPVEQIEIFLLNLDKTDELIDAGVSAAEAERASQVAQDQASGRPAV